MWPWLQAPWHADQLSIRIQVEIKGLEIDSCQCQLHASRCIPSCKLVLFSSGTLISGCSHTSDSQSVRGSEDGPSGAAPSCAVSGPGGPGVGLWAWDRPPLWAHLQQEWAVRPPGSGWVCWARWHPAGRVRPCRLFLGPDLHPEALHTALQRLPTLAPAGPSPPVDHTALPRGLAHCTVEPPLTGPGQALTSRWPHFSSPAHWAEPRSWPPPRRPANAFCWAGSVGARGMLCEEISVRCASWGLQASQEAGEREPSSSSWKGDKRKDELGGSFRPEVNKAVDSQQFLRTLPPHCSFLWVFRAFWVTGTFKNQYITTRTYCIAQGTVFNIL